MIVLMMERKKRQAYLVGLIFSALFSGCHLLPSTPCTSGLPQVDKVELFQLEKKGDLWTGKYTAQKTLIGPATELVAQLWRNQSFADDSPICHNPGYEIKFYRQNKLLVDATLCWDCDNLEFLTPKLNDFVGFDGKGRQGQELLNYLENTLSSKQ
jgi:hypothetical protein